MKHTHEFGVLVVGDEILNGKRKDRHLAHVIERLEERGSTVAWSMTVGDHGQRLQEILKCTQQDDIPAFCFGGIGATPDDNTRQAAAQAFGAPLTRNQEAVKSIEARFGEAAYPNRIRMADLPLDCLLIPNEHNGIPGFTLYEHHFFPGFPQMAWPMLDWVMKRYYPGKQAVSAERAIRLLGVKESDLLPLMGDLCLRHPRARLFSLPHLGKTDFIEMGFRGEQVAVEDAFHELLSEVRLRGIVYAQMDG